MGNSKHDPARERYRSIVKEIFGEVPKIQQAKPEILEKEVSNFFYKQVKDDLYHVCRARFKILKEAKHNEIFRETSTSLRLAIVTIFHDAVELSDRNRLMSLLTLLQELSIEKNKSDGVMDKLEEILDQANTINADKQTQ